MLFKQRGFFCGTTNLACILKLNRASHTPVTELDSIWLAGKVFMDFGMTHDYRGRPRSIEVEQGAIAADHGRCSDIG